MVLEEFIKNQKTNLQRKIDEHNASCIELYGQKDSALSAWATGFFLYVYEKTYGKIGLLNRTMDKLDNLNYFKKISSEKSLEKLANYGGDASKRIALSPLFFYMGILTIPLSGPLVFGNLGLFFYFLARGGKENILARTRIRELLYKEVPFDEKRKQLEERLYMKKKEKLSRYLHGVAAAGLVLPLSGLLVSNSMYSLYQGNFKGALFNAPFFLAGCYFGLRGIGQFFGIKENLQKEENEIVEELRIL